MLQQKKVFKFIFIGLAIILMALPFILPFNDILTRIVEKAGWYLWIQEKIVPWEVKMVGVMVKPLGIKFTAYADGFTANGIYAKFSWNCIGWQSLALFLISLPFGFKGGDYTFFSKAEAFLIGILGTFLINLLRVAFTVVLLVVSRPLYAIVFHDYLAAIMTICWLVVFWWFCYAYILEERNSDLKKD